MSRHTPLFKYVGGKSHLLKWTMDQIPTTTAFVDLFGGAGNIIRQSRAPVRIYNDFDGPDTFFYMDPPYHPETRQKNLYDMEFGIQDYNRLFSSLKNIKGKVALAGYYHKDYDQLGWNRTEIAYKNNMAQTKTKSSRVECLWKNY